jgi:hypothetical protein
MQRPIFVWKSGTLDFCDSLADFEERYHSSELSHEDVVACDSQGRALWISRIKDGALVNVAEESQAESPELLRSILWRYLEGRGTPLEEIKSLSLSELVARVCPDDPMGEYRQEARAHGYLALLIFFVLAFIAAVIFDQFFNLR